MLNIQIDCLKDSALSAARMFADTPGSFDDETDEWRGNQVAQNWMFIDPVVIEGRPSQVLPKDLRKDILSILQACEFQPGPEETQTPSDSPGTVPSQARASGGTKPPETALSPDAWGKPRLPMAHRGEQRLKPSRLSQWIRKMPARWREVSNTAHNTEVFRKWAESTGSAKNTAKTLALFHQWLHERLDPADGPMRSCEPWQVKDMTLHFRKTVTFKIRELTEEGQPQEPDPEFCSKNGLQGCFYATDFPLTADFKDPRDLTIRYHGTNLYALSAALASGMLVGHLGCTG